MGESFVQDHPTGKRQRHVTSSVTLSLYPLRTWVYIFGFKTCDWICDFKSSFCSGICIFTSNSTHLRPCHSEPVCVCKLRVCTEHLSGLHVASWHRETQACVGILANNVCKYVLIFLLLHTHWQWMIRGKREKTLWTEGCGDELLSPACPWLDGIILSGSRRYLETTDEKKMLPYSTPGGSESPKHKVTHNAVASTHYSGRRIS